MKKHYDGEIPFDSKGNQLHYPEHAGTRWQQNTVVEGRLRIVGMSRGRSAAYFHGELDGKGVVIFMADLLDLLPHMIRGVVRGKFTFCKRGMNYGCKWADA